MGIERPRECQLVLACARRTLSDARRQKIGELCDASLDWESVDVFARRHGLLPLVFHHLPAIAPERIPRDRYVRWWASCEELARRNGRMALVLEDIMASLRAGGIAAIPYKGPTLALAAYGDLALRQFGDLDVLVAPSAVRHAVKLLAGAGYRSELSLPAEMERALVMRSRHYEWPLRHETTGFLVELHWRADPEYRVIDLEAAEPGLLSPTLLSLVLCLHGTKHFWSRASWIADVAALAEASPIDWTWISRESRRLGCTRQVALGLKLASDLLEMATPPPFLEDVRDPIVAEMAVAIAGEIFAFEGAQPLGRAFRRNVALRSGARAKVSYAWRWWAAPGLGDWQRWRVPAGLSASYWLLRPMRLAEKYLLRRTPAVATPRTPPPPRRSTG
jgi:hypothetical protein